MYQKTDPYVREAMDFGYLFQSSPQPETITIKEKRLIYNLVLLNSQEQMDSELMFNSRLIETAQICDQLEALIQEGIERPKARPVLTFVLNMSGKKWLGPANIKDMYPDSYKEQKEFPIIDYPLRLFDGESNPEEIACLDESVQTILQLALLQNEPEKQRQWVKDHQDFFEKLDRSQKEFVEKVLKQPLAKIFKEKELSDKPELYQQGYQEGFQARLDQIIQRLNILGYSIEEISAITDLSHTQLIEKVDQFQS